MKNPQNLKAIVIRKRTQEMYDRIARQDYDYDNDLKTLLGFLEQAEGLEETLLEAEITKSIGTLNAIARRYDDAIHYFQKASALFLAERELNAFMATRSNIGVAYEMSYRREDAITVYQDALTHIDLSNATLKDYPVLIILLSNLGIGLQRAGRDDEAEPYYLKVIELLSSKDIGQIEQRRVGESATMARNGLANIYRRRGAYQKAWDEARLAYEVAWGVQIPLRVFYALNTKINLAIADPNSPEPPETYWNQLETYIDQRQSKSTLTFLAQIYLEEAELFQQKGEEVWARRYAERAQQIYTDFGDDAGVSRTASFLNQV